MIAGVAEEHVGPARRRATPRDHRALRRLVGAGVAKVADVRSRYAGKKSRGSLEKWYYLDRTGGEPLLMGAFAADVEDAKTARDNWKYHQQPSRREHAHLRNEVFILSVLDAEHENARRGWRFVEIDREEIYGESCPEYPLYGARINVDKAGAPKPARPGGRGDYEWFIPDGRMEVGWRAKLAGEDREPDLLCAFDFEVEMRARTKKVFEKIDKRAGWIHRLVSAREQAWVKPRMAAWKASRKADGKDPEGIDARREYERLRRVVPWLGLPPEVAPVVFVYPTAKMALAMRGRVAEAAELGDARLRRYAALARKVDAQGGHDLGSLFLFCGWDELRPEAEKEVEYVDGKRTAVVVEAAHGSVFGKSYAPLGAGKSPSGGGRVDLHATAVARKLMLTSRDRMDDAPASPGQEVSA